MMMKNKVLYNALYLTLMLVLLILNILIVCGQIHLIILLKLTFVVFPIILYKFLKFNNSYHPFFHTMWIISALAWICYFSTVKRTKWEIDKYGGTISYAIIYDRYSSYQSSNNVCFYYFTDKGDWVHGHGKCSNSTYHKLKIGDTILVVTSNLNALNHEIYKYFPTHEEIQKYKNGVLYEPEKQKK